MTIVTLPDDVLLDIFDFSKKAESVRPWPWERLVHVCQRWRYIVFGSPLRLDLRLLCTSTTPVRKTLGVWPPFPIEIFSSRAYDDMANIIAALEHPDRVRKIWLSRLTCPQLEGLASKMQEPFPALTMLQLSTDGTAPALPDMFLGGSTPHLQRLDLEGIPFPRLPRLLSSATDLSYLSLWEIPHTGYISPEAMVTCLSTLTRLTRLRIGFESPTSRPDRRGPPPLTRVILPALVQLEFHGVSEYLEDFVARIDAPRLLALDISFFHQLIYDVQQLPHFISHAGSLRSSSHAEVVIAHNRIDIKFDPSERTPRDLKSSLQLGIHCGEVDWQVSFMAQICNQLSFLPSIVEQLDINVGIYLESTLQVDMEDTQWLELFRPFTAVRTLRIRYQLQSLVLPALQKLTGERATEVLPALDSLYLEVYPPPGSDQQAIESFVAARQHSDPPVAVRHWVVRR